MSIRMRLLALMAGFALTAVIITALGLMTLFDYSAMMRASDRAWENSWRAERLNHLVTRTVADARGMFLARDAGEMTGFNAAMNQDLDGIENLLPQWHAADADEVRLVAAIDQDASDFIAVRRQAGQLAASGHMAEAETLSVGNRARRMAFQADLDKLGDHIRGDLATARRNADTYARTRVLTFFITAAGGIVLMTGVVLWALARFVTRPLENVARAIVDTADGDYATPLPARDGSDEMSLVWRALATLKARAIEAERLAQLHREAEAQKEMELRQLLLD